MLPEETVEDDYTLKFKQMVVRRGLLVDFDRDRARVDLGIMPNPQNSPVTSPGHRARCDAG